MREDEFFQFAHEREAIRIKKEAGEPKPWTEDPVLQNWFFCNVFREDDRVTRWFADNIRSKAKTDAERVMACAVFRFVNTIHAGRVIADTLLGGWKPDLFRRCMTELKRSSPEPLFGAAYMIKSPALMNKIDGIVQIMEPLARDVLEIVESTPRTLKAYHEALLRYEYFGRFMAYEIVTDLRHTPLLQDAPDIMTWASPGPGAARGLGYLQHNDPTYYNYNSQNVVDEKLMPLMQHLLRRSADMWAFPRKWEMREVEHVLCEYAKYRKAQTGNPIKRKYNGLDNHD